MTRPAGWRSARAHLLAIALLYALVIPVAYFDSRELRGSGGDWISLDLRGVFVAGYLVVAGLCVAVLLLHLNVKRLGKPFSVGLVLGCLFAPAILVPIGSSLYVASLPIVEEQRAEAVRETANALADAVQVRWSVSLAHEPPRFELVLTSAVSVAVLHVAVMGSAASQNGSFISSSSSDGEALTFRLEPGVPRRVTLNLDHAPTPDTYWSIYCRLVADGTTVGVNWADPSQEPFGGDAIRRLPLH